MRSVSRRTYWTRRRVARGSLVRLRSRRVARPGVSPAVADAPRVPSLTEIRPFLTVRQSSTGVIVCHDHSLAECFKSRLNLLRPRVVVRIQHTPHHGLAYLETA